MALAIALFQPDIAGNTGAIFRLAACFSLELHLIEPLGFALCDKKLKRAAMDYSAFVNWQRHIDWQHFYQYSLKNKRRLIAFTTKASASYHNFCFQNNDILLFGSESKGLNAELHERANFRLNIPIDNNMRSLNLALSAAIAASEAKRQLDWP